MRRRKLGDKCECGTVFPYDAEIHCQLYKGHTIPHEYHDIIKMALSKREWKATNRKPSKFWKAVVITFFLIGVYAFLRFVIAETTIATGTWREAIKVNQLRVPALLNRIQTSLQFPYSFVYEVVT